MISLTGTLFGQQLDSKYEALFIYNFTKYIEWKDNGTEAFVVSVLGKGDIYNELVKMANSKKIAGKQIVIASYVNAIDITSCDVVFVTYKSSDQLSLVLERMKGSPTLIVSEKPGMAQQGSGINFLNRGGKLTFELNKTRIDESGLKVFGVLSQLAIKLY
ncbi:MAG: YfiR family protein [Flavobacteriales bacterium]|nr:YfiR family protein [Flavobacteriales bacterium]